MLLVLVLLGSALSVVLALTRPGADAAGMPPGATGAAGYEPADLLGPGGDALDAVVAALPATLSYDHRDLDRSLARATRGMTPAYAAVYTRTFDRRVRPLATREKSIAEGRVRGAGVVRTDGDTAVTCLVFIDQVQVAPRPRRKGAEPRVLSSNRVRVDLVLRDGRWLIEAIRAV